MYDTVALPMSVGSSCMQLFNEFNARSIENKVNVWSGLWGNTILYVLRLAPT